MAKIHEYQQIFSKPIEFSENTINSFLASLLTPKRYDHVLRVLETANRFTEQCSFSIIDKERVSIAVLLHDLAKGMTDLELKEYAYSHRISLKDVPPPVYHAIVGAWLAEHYFSIKDREILEAIYYHTTGSVNFINNKIGAILFLADYLEPGREFDSNHICELIPDNILLALKEVVKEKIISVIQRNRVLDQESIAFYHSLIQL